MLLAVNAETARQQNMYRSDREKLAAELIKNPLSTEKAFAHFGLLLGAFPPAAIFTKFFLDAGTVGNDQYWIVGILLVVNLISAVVGYFSGKLIGKTVREIEKFPWTAMLLISPLIGMLWGIVAGGAGGVVIFFVGAIFGALLGGAVGAAALPVFAIFHRLLKKGEVIDQRHFLPVAFGVTLTICAFILGM